MRAEDKVLELACLLTLFHYTGAYMRVPVLPLYATAHGATSTQVGLVMGGHMVVAALAAIPFGVASDRWGASSPRTRNAPFSVPTISSTPALGSCQGR